MLPTKEALDCLTNSLVSTIQNVKQMVRKICIPMTGPKYFIELTEPKQVYLFILISSCVEKMCYETTG